MPTSEALSSLNNELWTPFAATYAAGDADGFLTLYSPDLIRAGGPTRQVIGFDEYATQTREWFRDLSARGSSVAIEFRFTERLAGAELASERGIYRIVGTNADGDHRVFYGGFQTFARRTDGRWRFVADYDRNDADEDAFTAAYAANDVDAFTA